ncbi:hypothetical protein CDL15_Pgr008312 [Punica granatum]|uniref:Uncharacterized protein n=1 Tax=Punica granatum TaxID=22663 RepID=A0A218XT84_PUNGR|nr:hypothetical protein CDL15_Pgr008312 [Punica granatum]
MQMTFAASGQGHALFIRVVACDLLRREGWDSMSKYQEAGREVFIVRIEIVWGLSEELALSGKVGRPSSHRLPCHGGRMKIVGGLPSLGGFDSPIVRKC